MYDSNKGSDCECNVKGIKVSKIEDPMFNCVGKKSSHKQDNNQSKTSSSQSQVPCVRDYLHGIHTLTTHHVVGDAHTINKRSLSKNKDEVYVTLESKELLGPSRCTIQSSINEYPIDTLIDTGADSCYIKETLCEQLNLQIEPFDCEVVAGNNQRLVIVGKVFLQLSIADCQYPIHCLVVQTLSFPLILGWNGFIKKHKSIIDSATNTVRLRRPITPNENFAFLEDSMTLPPYTEVATPVKIHQTNSASTIFISRYNELFRKTGITVLPGIHDGQTNQNQKNLNIVLTNLSETPVYLHKDSIVALFESYDGVAVESLDGNLNSLSDKGEQPDLTINTPLDHLKNEEQDKVRKLLNKYQDLFILKGKNTIASNVSHSIDTGSARPIHCPPQRLGFKEREHVHNQVDEMLRNKVIQESISPWSSRIVLVKKKDGKLRFCVDYRALNKLTKRDVYPLSRIDDTLSMLQKGRYFSTLDLYAGYWQIPLDKNSREKTAFTTDNGLFEFNVMPFGLCNAPATFQRFMDATMAGLKWKSLMVYMDDIIIFSATFEKHLEDLEEVFLRLQNVKVTLNLEKCAFFRKKIKYLGHIISDEGIQPCNERIDALAKKKSPENVKELRTWLGMVSYYRSFIPQFSKLCAPLYALTHHNVPFKWTEKEEAILQQLIKYLVTEPILMHPNFDFPFMLHTDASFEGLGAALSQDINGKERVIQYISRTVQPNEKKWNIQQLEALAIIWACETVRPYIIGTKVLIFTDHKSLQWLKESKIPRLVRWACRLEEFDYQIVYKPGKFNTVADALSRLGVSTPVADIGRKYPSIDYHRISSFI